MIRQAQALALFFLMALTTSLQGTSVMQCLCSGRVVIAGFGETGCPVKRDTAKPHCPNCARRVTPIPETEFCGVDCWRVLDFGDGQQLGATVTETSSTASAVIHDRVLEVIPPRTLARRESIAHRPPDPPGPPLTILYASFLI